MLCLQIARSPRLRVLDLRRTRLTEYSAARVMQPQTGRKSSFHPLQKLVCSLENDTLLFLTPYFSLAVEELILDIRNACPRTTLQTISSCHSLIHLSIGYHSNVAAFSAETLLEVTTSCPMLKTLLLYVGEHNGRQSGPPFSDDHMERLARSLPRLQALKLELRDEHYILTKQAFKHLGNHCRVLWYLNLGSMRVFHLRKIQRSGEILFPKLEVLYVRRALWTAFEQALSAQLFECAPALRLFCGPYTEEYNRATMWMLQKLREGVVAEERTLAKYRESLLAQRV